MFKERIKWAKKKIKEKELDKDIWLLEKNEWYDRGYWYGYIEGLKFARKNVKNNRIIKGEEKDNDV